MIDVGFEWRGCLGLCVCVINQNILFYQNKGDNTINNANEKVVMEMYYADFDEIINDISLRGTLQEFHEDFKYPVYKEKKIPDDSEVLNITRSAGKT